MSETKARSGSMTTGVGKFEFRWSNTGGFLDSSEASVGPVSPGYAYEAVIEGDSVPNISVPDPVEDTVSVETVPLDSFPPMTSESYPPDGSAFGSPKADKKMSLPSLTSISRSMRLRFISIGAWSGVTLIGAGAIMSSAGSTEMMKLDVLGAVWAGVTGSVWILVGRLAK